MKRRRNPNRGSRFAVPRHKEDQQTDAQYEALQNIDPGDLPEVVLRPRHSTKGYGYRQLQGLQRAETVLTMTRLTAEESKLLEPMSVHPYWVY